MKPGLPQPQLAIATAVAVGAAIVLGYLLLISPQRSTASRLERQVEEARAALAEAQGRRPEPEVQPIRVADLFHLSRAMPDRPDLPDLLLQLSQTATETGITFKSVTPGDPLVVGSYQQLPIEVVLQGHFYDLSDFLYRLRNLVGVHAGRLDASGRLFAVDSISFGEGDAQFPEVEAKLKLDAYVYGDGSSAPAPASTASSREPAEGASQAASAIPRAGAGGLG